MTLLAVQAGVAAQQRIAGLAVIELLLGRLPFVDAELLSVVLRMAAHTIHGALGPVNHAPVVPLVLLHQGSNLGMTIQALELGRTRAKHVATGRISRYRPTTDGPWTTDRVKPALRESSPRQTKGRQVWQHHKPCVSRSLAQQVECQNPLRFVGPPTIPSPPIP